MLRDGREVQVSVTPEYYEGQGQYMLGVQLGTAMTNEVTGVQDDTLAAEMGLKSGDRIVEINGTRIDDTATIVNALEGLKNGTEVNMTVRRDGNRLTLTASSESRRTFLPVFHLKPSVIRLDRSRQ